MGYNESPRKLELVSAQYHPRKAVPKTGVPKTAVNRPIIGFGGTDFFYWRPFLLFLTAFPARSHTRWAYRETDCGMWSQALASYGAERVPSVDRHPPPEPTVQPSSKENTHVDYTQYIL